VYGSGTASAITAPPGIQTTIVRAVYAVANRSGVTVQGSTGHKGPMVTVPARVPVPPPEPGAVAVVIRTIATATDMMISMTMCRERSRPGFGIRG